MNKVIEWTVFQLMTDTAVLAEQRLEEQLYDLVATRLCGD